MQNEYIMYCLLRCLRVCKFVYFIVEKKMYFCTLKINTFDLAIKYTFKLKITPHHTNHGEG